MGKLRKGLEKGREGEGKERGKKGMWVASSPKIIAMCFVFLVDVNHTGSRGLPRPFPLGDEGLAAALCQTPLECVQGWVYASLIEVFWRR